MTYTLVYQDTQGRRLCQSKESRVKKGREGGYTLTREVCTPEGGASKHGKVKSLQRKKHDALLSTRYAP